MKYDIFVKDIILRGNAFLFVVGDKKNLIKEEDNNNTNSNNDTKMGKMEDEDSSIYFYGCEKNIEIGNKLFYSGTIDIAKLVGEKDYIDRVKLKKPKMINVDEDFIKQNYLKKKTDLTLKVKDVLFNGNRLFLSFDYYHAFVNPKKIVEESNFVLKNEKLKFI